jgi:hypothetical protein
VHAALSNPSRLPFLEHVAKNAGARAARGAFLLATNPDVLPCAAPDLDNTSLHPRGRPRLQARRLPVPRRSEALVRRLAEHTALDPGAFYRVDRQDLARGVPPARARARGLDAARRCCPPPPAPLPPRRLAPARASQPRAPRVTRAHAW